MSSNVWLYSQVFQNSPYEKISSKNLGGRSIEKYYFNTNRDITADKSVAEAALVINNLISTHTNLCPTFPIFPKAVIEDCVRKNPYLTINGRAISLSAEKEASGDDPVDFRDRFFSETLLEEPVTCPSGHRFEKARAKIWADTMNNICPVEKPSHLIGDLEIDDEHQSYIQNYIQTLKERQEKLVKDRDRVDRQQKLLNLKLANQEMKQSIQQQQIASQQLTINNLSGIKTIDPVTMITACSKIVVKLGGRKFFIKTGSIFARYIAKESAKKASISFGKAAAKKIPFISFLAGMCFAAYRCYQGQHFRAFGEVASGLLACAPVYGTAASAALDIVIGLGDVYEAVNSKKTLATQQSEFIPEVTIDLKSAYGHLGIDLETNNNPTKNDVDNGYRKQMIELHPDKNPDLGEYNLEQFNEIAALINACKEMIYKNKCWV